MITAWIGLSRSYCESIVNICQFCSNRRNEVQSQRNALVRIIVVGRRCVEIIGKQRKTRVTEDSMGSCGHRLAMCLDSSFFGSARLLQVSRSGCLSFMKTAKKKPDLELSSRHKFSSAVR